MKNIVIAGRLTRDAELRRTTNGDPVLSFSVAVDDRVGKEKRTLFFDCSMWGNRGEGLSKFLTKGNPVTVSGDLSTREHDGRTYLTVRVNEVTLQGGRSEEPRQSQPKQSYGEASGGGRPHDELNDDLPF